MSNIKRQRIQAEKLVKICTAAWNKNLLQGFGGNASLRLNKNEMLITKAATAKGLSGINNFLPINFQGEVLAGAGCPSSEWRMHAALYVRNTACKAILHTHPGAMQSLELVLKAKYTPSQGASFQDLFLKIPLFEASQWRKHLFFADEKKPGSADLAQSCANALPDQIPPLPVGIWLPLHGLCVMAATIEGALALSEEFEHLAKIQLNIVRFQES